jgi:hypothetical protein
MPYLDTSWSVPTSDLPAVVQETSEYRSVLNARFSIGLSSLNRLPFTECPSRDTGVVLPDKDMGVVLGEPGGV